MEETWKTWERFPNYQVSNFGRFRSIRCRGKDEIHVHDPQRVASGYLVVRPYLKARKKNTTIYLQRVVMEVFVGPAEGRHVNHKNGMKRDNALSNLEYVDRGDNMRHAYKTGRMR